LSALLNVILSVNDDLDTGPEDDLWDKEEEEDFEEANTSIDSNGMYSPPLAPQYLSIFSQSITKGCMCTI
jgi:hypothetical protein